MSHTPEAIKKLRTLLIGLIAMPIGGALSGFLLSQLGFALYYGSLENSLKIEEIVDASLPTALANEGVTLAVSRDSDDLEVKNSTLTYGSESIEWKRSYDLDWNPHRPTFISANLDQDELPELIAVHGSVSSGASFCRSASSFTVFDFSESDIVTSCTLPDRYRLYLTDRYHSFLGGVSLTTSLRVACLLALLFPLGFWGYQVQRRKHRGIKEYTS